MALWCSRLARQPVTLEVDGSSPFGVAKEETTHSGGFFFIIAEKDSNWKSHHASGVLQPPVQKLVASSIFAEGKYANESVRGRQKETTHLGGFLFIIAEKDSN